MSTTAIDTTTIGRVEGETGRLLSIGRHAVPKLFRRLVGGKERLDP
jgi:hypothetical protein